MPGLPRASGSRFSRRLWSNLTWSGLLSMAVMPRHTSIARPPHGMMDPSGTTVWSYDTQGRIIGKTQVVDGASLVTSYVYDGDGRLASLTYPSGEVINYSWSNGQLTGIFRGTSLIASGITCHPFGPVKSWTLDNGQNIVRNFDLDGRITSYSLGSLAYDAASRITGISRGGISILGNSKTYGYDATDRLISFSDGTSAETYAYDASGNRTGQTINGMAYTYSVSYASNRLDAMAGPGSSLHYSYDANGSLVNDGQRSFGYDASGRLSEAVGLASYSFNGLGQRVKKNAGTVIMFVFDEGGQLIGEYGAAGNPIQETVWLDDVPLAVLRYGTTYYIHTDHLNTPPADS
ncbi:conserved hypothetical protein [Nitrosospira multiformis ATCC 25196]|uniref:Teneurin-like YD-shell domain-containing protein n=2 Tax=Nitrosospira multiformis (strain ATCC 25196 / NCIMB 11849 / C 71) TaxID=323848 RepID=Q2Y6N7_NITMU|nr:conserved hypothetical protein [Nitrosospira multiformis ATCC 25196]